MNNNETPALSAGLKQPRDSPRASASKDNLQSSKGLLTLVGKQFAEAAYSDPLVFWTLSATKPYLIDLREFATGVQKNGDINASFSARRALIEQIAPAFKERHCLAAPRTIETVISGLRKWWRLFDAIESEESSTISPGETVSRLSSVLDLGAFHGNRAVQSGMSKNDFHSFVVLADITRLALGVKRALHWPTPTKRKRKLVDLLEPAEIKEVYHRIKADWHNAVDRWWRTGQLTEGLSGDRSIASNDLKVINTSVNGGREIYERKQAAFTGSSCPTPRSKQEAILLVGLSLWQEASDRRGHVDLFRQDLIETAASLSVPEKALNISMITQALYPNGTDIRAAFYLCLAVGGLNSSVLLELWLDLPTDLENPPDLANPLCTDIERREWVIKICPFLIESPIDGEYYIEGWKDRSKSWVSRSYKWKQHLTPGPILVELIIRTWPLRLALIRRLDAATQCLKNAIDKGAVPDEVNAIKKQVIELTSAVRSVWIYRGMRGISWLTDQDVHALQPGQSYIQFVIQRINEDRRAKQKTAIPALRPSRFRDVYASWALGYSGGDVLSVMVALDHKRLETTEGYLDNSVVRSRINKKHASFSNALFGALSTGKLDPTLLAIQTRYSGESSVERTRMAERLIEYRDAVKSRYGIGCRDPYHPSKLVDPDFTTDGIKTCSLHRCTLCHDNAIITPSSYPGLMLRQAELEIREESMPVTSFMLSSYDAELQNVRSALLPLMESDPKLVMATIGFHKDEIRTGRLRVPSFSLKPI